MTGDVAVFLDDGRPVAASGSPDLTIDSRQSISARSFSDALDKIPSLFHSEEYPVSEWLLKITEISKKLRDKAPPRRVYKALSGML